MSSGSTRGSQRRCPSTLADKLPGVSGTVSAGEEPHLSSFSGDVEPDALQGDYQGQGQKRLAWQAEALPPSSRLGVARPCRQVARVTGVWKRRECTQRDSGRQRVLPGRAALSESCHPFQLAPLAVNLEPGHHADGGGAKEQGGPW